jgi:hypothetical protein
VFDAAVFPVAVGDQDGRFTGGRVRCGAVDVGADEEAGEGFDEEALDDVARALDFSEGNGSGGAALGHGPEAGGDQDAAADFGAMGGPIRAGFEVAGREMRFGVGFGIGAEIDQA